MIQVDLIKRVEALGLTARVQLDEGRLKTKVLRYHNLPEDHPLHGRALWHIDFTQADILQAWLIGYERAIEDKRIGETSD